MERIDILPDEAIIGLCESMSINDLQNFREYSGRSYYLCEDILQRKLLEQRRIIKNMIMEMLTHLRPYQVLDITNIDLETGLGAQIVPAILTNKKVQIGYYPIVININMNPNVYDEIIEILNS